MWAFPSLFDCPRAPNRLIASFPSTNPPLAHDESLRDISTDMQDHHFSDFLRGVMTPTRSNTLGEYGLTDWQNPELGPRHVLDFNVDGNLEFDSADFNFLDQLCGKTINKPMESLSPDTVQVQIQEVGPASLRGAEARSVGLGTEAFRKSSLARWLPCHKENANVVMNEYLENGDSPPGTRLKLDKRPMLESLDQRSRDKILALVLNASPSEGAASIAASFPPAELLDDLMQNFFSTHRNQASSFIHIPTFRPNQQKPELLAATVAYGATLTGLKALHKFGLALQEAVRLTLPKRCDEANINTRELWLIQAFICVQEVGLWSGNKRKMEISESQTQIMTTVRALLVFAHEQF